MNTLESWIWSTLICSPFIMGGYIFIVYYIFEKNRKPKSKQ